MLRQTNRSSTLLDNAVSDGIRIGGKNCSAARGVDGWETRTYITWKMPVLGGAIIQCPNCQQRMGEVLFPNLKDTEEAAAQGNAEAKLRLPELLRELEQAQSRSLRFEQQKIMRVDRIPELAGNSLEFIWDLAATDGESYQVIRLGHTEVWKELAFFENIDRFNQVKELLRQKYGARFNALTPSRNRLEWLCGDNAGKLFRRSYT
jgi:hypothetical protein